MIHLCTCLLTFFVIWVLFNCISFIVSSRITILHFFHKNYIWIPSFLQKHFYGRRSHKEIYNTCLQLRTQMQYVYYIIIVLVACHLALEKLNNCNKSKNWGMQRNSYLKFFLSIFKHYCTYVMKQFSFNSWCQIEILTRKSFDVDERVIKF